MVKKHEPNGHHYHSQAERDEEEIFEEEGDFSYLTDELDHAILMHRDVHFSRSFQAMIEYYENEGIGAVPEFDIDRILYLADIEGQLGQDLSSMLLTGPEKEKVAAAHKAYLDLRAIYEVDNEKNPTPRLIADLLLSEEEEPTEEIRAVVGEKQRALPELIHILQSDEAYDPLYPGYGYAPYLAILCLTQIKDQRAIAPLFEAIGKESVFGEDVILEALLHQGDEAKSFLLKVLKSRPLSQDNVNAAFALSIFADDPQVAEACFHELKDPAVLDYSLLATYILLSLDSLKDTPYRSRVLELAKDPSLPQKFHDLLKEITSVW